ncbi:MAG: transcriptional repressor, partial [Alphaproteobacteria bacterium]|nr:transcriptional repressor [Alphaproteobacteria bacterium]
MKYTRTEIRKRPYTDALRRLKEGKLRPTKQRLALSKLLFEGAARHLTAESLYEEACSFGIKVSLATVYNTLNHFTEAGLLREVVVAP